METIALIVTILAALFCVVCAVFAWWCNHH